MKDYKKIAIDSILGFGLSGVIDACLGNEDDKEQEIRKERIASWEDFVTNLKNYRLQDRKCLMFLPDDDIRVIWTNSFPGDLEVVYLPYSYGIPEGITIEGRHLEEGNLYVYDPRDEYHYHTANTITNVLITDKFTEIKRVFESLGATHIDITFSALKDEKNEYISNNSQNISGHYGEHKASVGHSGSRSGTNHTSNYRQLEIHKHCSGKTSYINLEDCYWYQNDIIYQNEVQSVKSGSTLETNFVDTTKSYSSITSTRMDKIEAEYEYMSSIGVSGMVEWDNSTMQEITQTVVWDVHIQCSNNNQTSDNMKTWQDYFTSQSREYNILKNISDTIQYRPLFISAESAQSDLENLEELATISGDQFASMIFMFEGIIGLNNNQFSADGYDAIQSSLNIDKTLNYSDKKNIFLAYKAKNAKTLEELSDIVSQFDNNQNNWHYISELFSTIVYGIIDEKGYTLLGFEDNASDKDVKTSCDAYRVLTNVPNDYMNADAMVDLIGLYIHINAKESFITAQNAYEKYKNYRHTNSYQEAFSGDTITFNKMGAIINCLGQCYFKGLGTQEDKTKAFNLFNEAYNCIKKGEPGSNCAVSSLAECYTYGYGTTVDLKKAVELYTEEIKNLEQLEGIIYSIKIDQYKEQIKEIEEGKIQSIQKKNNNVNSNEQEYLEEYKCILADGEIGSRERKSLERLATKLGISAGRVIELENSLNNISLTAEEQEYLEEYKQILADGEIGPRERKSLERLAGRLGIAQERAKELEKQAS